MARQTICDKCKRPCQRIVLKLYIAPKNGDRPGGDHANYTGHADIGECCAAEVTGMFKWSKRKPRGRAA